MTVKIKKCKAKKLLAGALAAASLVQTAGAAAPEPGSNQVEATKL